MKTIALATPLAFVLACSADATTSSRVAPTIDGTNHDASVCGGGSTSPAVLRCRAKDAHALRVGFASCGDLAVDNTLTIEPRKDRTALAVNGNLRTASPLHVAGDVIVGGAVEAANTQTIDFDLRAGGGWTTSAPVLVGGDAYVGTKLDVRNDATVRGALHVPPGTDVTKVTANDVVYEDVMAPAPALCTMAPDVATLAQMATLDSAALKSLPSGALATITRPTKLTLGCGTYVLDGIDAGNTLDIRVVGPTTLVVKGDVHVRAPMVVHLDGAAATLDFVITGTLAVDDTLAVGSAEAPTKTFVAIGTALRVASPMKLFGTLVAPTATAALDNTFDVWGATLLGKTRIAAPLVVHEGPALSQTGCVVED